MSVTAQSDPNLTKSQSHVTPLSRVWDKKRALQLPNDTDTINSSPTHRSLIAGDQLSSHITICVLMLLLSNKLFLELGALPKTTVAMSFVFRGARPDIENGLSGFVPGRRTMRLHAARPINTNSLAFLVTVLLLFTILNTHQMSPNFLLWLVLGVFLVATTLRMYATCQQLQAQAQAHAAAATGLLSRTEFRLQMPPSIALATRGRLHGLRLQLALLDREFDDLGTVSGADIHYETLRALDSDNGTRTTSMSEEEINALPVHNSSSHLAIVDFVFLLIIILCHLDPLLFINRLHGIKSLSSSDTVLFGFLAKFIPQIKVDIEAESNTQASEEELTCSICLEQVNRGEIVRSLPCLHQFHANCIDPWLRQQGTCPVCKLTVGSGCQENTESETDGDDM
ncbi:hypothetical protein RJ639_016039, partial [Escallonia herrerae]